jgi:hypothetical protein
MVRGVYEIQLRELIIKCTCRIKLAAIEDSPGGKMLSKHLILQRISIPYAQKFWGKENAFL